MGVARCQEGVSWNCGVTPPSEPSVAAQATALLLNDPAVDHEYLPITGLPQFTEAAAKLILGPDSPAITEGRVTSVQTISGTGANHLGALFLSRYYHFGEGDRKVWLSDPTWGAYTLALCHEQIALIRPAYVRVTFRQSTISLSSGMCSLSR